MIYLRKGEITAVLVLTCLLFWHCREKPVPPKVIAKETIVENTNPKVIVDLCEFAGVSINDTINVDPLLNFKVIDSSGEMAVLDRDMAGRLFKRIKSGKKVSEIPLIEFKGTDKTLMMLNGRGYGGSIWATLILNNKTLQLELVQFEHRAESEGYASGITMSSFEDQFRGIEIKDGGVHYSLEQSGKLRSEGAHPVDGISGATQTSMAVINMMNNGLRRIKNYAFPQ